MNRRMNQRMNPEKMHKLYTSVNQLRQLKNKLFFKEGSDDMHKIKPTPTTDFKL